MRKRACCTGSCLLACAWLSLLPLALRADASLRYVNTAGDDSADGLTPDTAWRTLTRADEQAPPGAAVRVAAGVYRENTAGAGHFRLSSSMMSLAYVADGEVRLQAEVPGACVLDIATIADPSFSGFIFDGADSCAALVVGAACALSFHDCRFIGAGDAAVQIAGGGGLVIDDCEFGTAMEPLCGAAVQLADCPAASVADCDIFVAAAGALRAIRCPSLRVTANSFGSSAQSLALGAQWAVLATDSDRIQITDNVLFLSSGHGLGLPAGTLPISAATVTGNTLQSTSLANQYGIMVGSETPVAIAYQGVEVANNHISLPVPTADTAKHDLFVGYTLQPAVHDNEVLGGGYGLVIKGNDGADVYDNSILGT
jgi:hypothetical protein